MILVTGNGRFYGYEGLDEVELLLIIDVNWSSCV